MVRITSGASYAARCTVWLFIAFLVVLAGSNHADARRHHRRGHVARHESYNPPYAAIVVDANSGATLHEASADSQRHPASLTKIMTLYLLFERLDSGKIKLDSDMTVSAHAASMAPSKLGLRPGQTIKVEDAIRAVVTKSANDIAVVIAETLGDDEESFAELMTKKARALGMSRTTYVNASGLPDDEQITTARDQAILGRAIQERFPRYYSYFSTPNFSYHGQWMRNHNHLLGQVEGVDGIKTGYTVDSGFNLVTSVRRGNRHIVAVVLGGRSAGARDARMRELINEKIVEASVRKTATPLVDVAEKGADKAGMDRPDADNAPQRIADKPADKPAAKGGGFALASASSAVVTLQQPRTPAVIVPAQADARIDNPAPRPGQAADAIEPIRVKTIKVKGNFTKMALAGSVAPQSFVNQQPDDVATQSTPAPKTADPAPKAVDVAKVAPKPEPVRVAAAGSAAAVKVEATPAESAKAEPTAASHATRGGWIVQVGAFPAVTEAKERLASAQNKAKDILGRADPFTEPVVRGSQTLYRARFAGLDKDAAEAACRTLKRNDIACLAVRN